ALSQMRENGNLLFAIAVQATAGLVLLAQPISSVLLGVEFRETALTIIPWIAVAIFIAGTKAYYFDAAFQLSRRSLPLLWGVAAGASLNFLLNLLWIPVHGVMGAAYAMLASHSVALLVCIAVGRRYIPITPDGGQLLRILLATACMALVLAALPTADDFVGLAIRVGAGMAAYAAAALVLDVLRGRSRWLERALIRKPPTR